MRAPTSGTCTAAASTRSDLASSSPPMDANPRHGASSASSSRRPTPASSSRACSVDGVRDWPITDSVIGTSGDTILYAFPQGEDKARLYIGYSIEDKTRLAGADKAKTFLEAFRVDTIPDSGRFVDASPAGPCAAYPMFDSWSDAVVADGVVFAGDAAGFSDPTIGEGLSVALRDARMIRDVLLGGEDWSKEAFTPYVEERAGADAAAAFRRAGLHRRPHPARA